MEKRIRINHSKSPFDFLKNKKEKKDTSLDKISIIEKIDNRVSKSDDLFDETEFITTKYEPSAKENMLLKLMYLEDVDSEYVKEEMRVTDKELQYIVDNLLDKGFVKHSKNDEIELTMEGIYHITSNDMDLF